ncbi:MAG: CAP domain-containing protein [Clostridia bacterium]|nr:CAP domain-containing protein [Clostridia bacterium]
MSKIKIYLILFLFVIAGIGFYFFKDRVVIILDNFRIKTREISIDNVGKILSEVEKKVITSEPLKIGGASNDVFLLKSKIISETNNQRIKNNLPILTENENLYKAAVVKANDMFLNQYFEHISLKGVGPGELVSNHGYEYVVTGENLILGNFRDELELVQDWMNSPGHRANILNKNYTEIGVAVIKGNYKGETVWIAVQEFGLPLAVCAQPDISLKEQIDAEESELNQLDSNLNDKKLQIENTDMQSSYYNQMIEDYNGLIIKYNFLAEQLKEIISQYNLQVKKFNECISAAQSE